MLVRGVSGGGRKISSARRNESDYHLDVRLVLRPIDILNVAGADCAGGDFGLKVAVGGGDRREEGIKAGEHCGRLFVSCMAWEEGGGEKIQSDEGNTGAIFGFLVRVGLVDTMWCGGDSSFLAKSKRKPGGRVSESFRGMLAICGGGGGVWWG